ncbi:putative bifunctional diguanylate cyclase/phosphodiesterase [Oryzibacter oryziterrae]|uniref:putative bifunctional diguanylate cyclase/phosphodiesterase n=1 Tax=Oryzibacter oryziterrae TaxID=2766474 RepID=UPI001F36852F|nr:EAL domain-containing protein [Oryzibacter oryziterrae]
MKTPVLRLHPSAIFNRKGNLAGFVATAPMAVAIVAQLALIAAVAYVAWMSDIGLADRQAALVAKRLTDEIEYYRKDIGDMAAWHEVSDMLDNGPFDAQLLQDTFAYSSYTFAHQKTQAVFTPQGKLVWLADEGLTTDSARYDELCAGCSDVAAAVQAKYAAADNHYMEDLFNTEMPFDERPALPASYPAVAKLVSMNGEPVYMMGSVINAARPQDRKAGPRYTLVTALHLDKTFLAQLGQDLGITGVAVATDRAALKDENSSPILATYDGQVLGYITWTHERPSLALLVKLLPVLAVFMLIFTGLVGALVRWLKRLSIDQLAGEVLSSHMALHDPLTGLGNRAYLANALDEVLPQAVSGKHPAALLLLDMDGFKGVNDTYGHQVGDELIRMFADRLMRGVPSNARVVRLGGDEFAVIVPDADLSLIERLGTGILTFAREPFLIDGIEARVGCSVGVALAPVHAVDRTELLRKADLALYRAKTDGRNRWRLFEDSLDVGARQRRELEENLRSALESGDRFSLAYQPEFSVTGPNATPIGVEAALCWRHDSGVLVSARDMIRAAEEVGLASELGSFVLRRACQDRKAMGEGTVTVNMSPLDVADPTFHDRVMMILDTADFPPHRLEIELSDGLQHANAPQVLSALRRLKAAGVRLSIDGFGARYANIAQLRTLPISKVKLAPTLLRGLEGSPDAQRLVAAITALGKSIGLVVGAEGVETAGQLQFLKDAGCSVAQGSFLGIGDAAPSVPPQRKAEDKAA